MKVIEAQIMAQRTTDFLRDSNPLLRKNELAQQAAQGVVADAVDERMKTVFQPGESEAVELRDDRQGEGSGSSGGRRQGSLEEKEDELLESMKKDTGNFIDIDA